MGAVGTEPLFRFDYDAVIHNSDGTKAIRWNPEENRPDASSNKVFSLQDTGEFGWRWIEKPSPDFEGSWGIGAWEKGSVEGDRLVFRANNARAAFPWLD